MKMLIVVQKINLLKRVRRKRTVVAISVRNGNQAIVASSQEESDGEREGEIVNLKSVCSSRSRYRLGLLSFVPLGADIKNNFAPFD